MINTSENGRYEMTEGVYAENEVLEMARRAYEKGDGGFEVLPDNAPCWSLICRTSSSSRIGRPIGSRRQPDRCQVSGNFWSIAG